MSGYLIMLIDAIVPISFVAFLGYCIYFGSAWYNTRMVNGKPDEWVVVMSNG